MHTHTCTRTYIQNDTYTYKHTDRQNYTQRTCTTNKHTYKSYTHTHTHVCACDDMHTGHDARDCTSSSRPVPSFSQALEPSTSASSSGNSSSLDFGSSKPLQVYASEAWKLACAQWCITEFANVHLVFLSKSMRRTFADREFRVRDLWADKWARALQHRLYICAIAGFALSLLMWVLSI